MSSAFHCQNCGSVSNISNLLRDFEENPHCPTCGLSITESDTKMQDDLSDMMSRNLHLDAVQAPSHDVSMPPTPEVTPQPSPITYITMHYHHSAHQVPAVFSTEQSASTILRNAGVNPDALFPSQLSLFKNAQSDQQQRLIELWKIAPPTYGNQMQEGSLGNWPQTSLEQEEHAAKARWHSQEQDRLKNLSALPQQDPRANAEPYMMDGYQSLPNINGVTAPSEYQRSTDPVYSGREWWRMGNSEPRDHQYGMVPHLQNQFHNNHGNSADKDERMW